jgi:hypothetical protein
LTDKSIYKTCVQASWTQASNRYIEEAFALACHFAFIVPHDCIHVLPAGSEPGVLVFTLANKWGYAEWFQS